jgi:AmmeMemoRadiSam system protein A
MKELLSNQEKDVLLKIAREAIQYATDGKDIPVLDLSQYSEKLQDDGASFVTLNSKTDGQLRGCIGALEAYQPLVLDVQYHAVAAALEDYRFLPVTSSEVPNLKIEISRLTPPIPLNYSDPGGLSKLIKPGVDGVIIRDGFRKATFLPQVWEQLPNPEDFIDHLCRKMGAHSDLWRRKVLEVSVYQVEEFHE